MVEAGPSEGPLLDDGYGEPTLRGFRMDGPSNPIRWPK
jgi:hypothetical protein